MFLITTALAAPTHAEIKSATWAHIADRSHGDAGEVKVFNATIGGIQCFKASASTSEADGSTMLGVVTDVVGAKRWSSAGITQAEMLGKNGNRITYFQYLDVPGWTMSSDRYWFLTASVNDNPGRRSLEWDRIASDSQFAERYTTFKNENPKAVEPPVNIGLWEFIDEDFGVQVAYSICTDAGGAIPYAIQSAATRKTLPDTVGDVVREAKKRLGRD